MHDKSLYIDAQVFQSAAWDRGMGKYSLNLLTALGSSDRYAYKETFLLFNDTLELSAPAKKAIKNALPKAKLVFLPLQVPKELHLPNLQRYQDENEKTLNNYLADRGCRENSTDFIILSLFIDQVCSVFPRYARRILLFYDLIPLQYHKRYGELGTYANYLARYKTLLEADIILTISQTVADDLSLYLGVNPRKVQNIDGAPIQRAHQVPQKPSLDVPSNFLLMPSGDDLRKNNYRAVQAFEEYRRRYTDGDVWLVLTSFFHEETQRQLESMSDHVVFTGNVSEPALRWLYDKAKALLFVPEYEGLGLPILEAAEVNKPVICSNITVFNEMSVNAFYYCDQHDPVDIAEAINAALTGEEWEEKVKEYPSILAKYTWEETARKTLNFLENVTASKRADDKKRLAILTPNPAGYSAIGKVVLQLHPSLSQYFEIDYYIEDGRSKNAFSRPSYLSSIASVYPASEFNAKRYADYDAVIYHVGNSEFHLETVKNALHLPGYAIMHDAGLEGIFNLLKEYKYISPERYDAEADLARNVKGDAGKFLDSLVNAQRGVVAHSEFAEKVIGKRVHSDVSVPLASLNLPTATPRLLPQKTTGELHIAFAGIIHKAKGIDLIEDITTSSALGGVRVHLFGIPLLEEHDLRRLESLPNVEIVSNPTDFEFQALLSRMDVLVNYRAEYKGETSLTAIEAMRFGVVPIVRNIGWFSELPDDAVIKVDNPEEVIEQLQRLRSDRDTLNSMSESARTLMCNAYTYEQYAKDLASVLSRWPADKASTNELIAQALRNGAGLEKTLNIIRQA